ncbi:hypothetical protein CJJ23_01000 [Mycoplasmopsis agassizii]|uniref:Ribonuclease n=1 Tax=Mycoplasmopsis agassizii TaxID=33922 RepID=A0A269TL84_9BACT|nr:ribonuclease HIII [Mycoplasmopsis agassizii]PAK21698.1 hypothetical protein CJJ23_01000 [Mycoplasmopsis agassizii]
MIKIKEINEQKTLDELFQSKKVLGIDESGVGDYFTPLTAAVAIVEEKDFARLKELGVGDSKKISDKRIQELAKIIADEKLAKYCASFIHPKGYNNLKKNYNANEIKTFVHLKAFTDSQRVSSKNTPIKSIDFDYVFIDQYSTLNAIEGYFKRFFNDEDPKANWPKFRKFGKDIILSTKAEDKHLSVAVASIFARDLLLRKMIEYNYEWEAEFPLGASKDVQEFARKFIDERARGDKKKETEMRYNLIKDFKSDIIDKKEEQE